MNILANMENEAYKYNCEKCNFHSNYLTSWKNHKETELHKTGKRKTRSDKKSSKCQQCDYKSTGSTNLKQHVLNEHSNKEERKKGFKYYCEYCDYGTFAISFYNKHLNTDKHSNFIKFIK